MSKLGEELVEALGQALAHAGGKEPPGTAVHRVVVLTAADGRAVRVLLLAIDRYPEAVRDALAEEGTLDWRYHPALTVLSSGNG